MNHRWHHFGKWIVPAIGRWLLIGGVLVGGGLIGAGVGGCRSSRVSPQAMVQLPADAPPGAINSLLTQHTLTPDRKQAIERFNRAHGATSLWSRVELRLRWIDEQEENKGGSETADGHLMARFPDRVAISLSKLGHELLFAGCNPDRYWVIDLTADGGPLAYVGGAGSLVSRSSSTGLLPIRPDQLPWLLGGVPLDRDDSDLLSIQSVNGYWLIQPSGAPVRILMDPLTGQAARIDWVDPVTNLSSIICLPSRYEPIASASGQAGSMATRWEIFVPARRSRISVKLSDLQDGTLERRIRSGLFDPGYLLDKHYQVPTDRRIDLEKR